MTPHDGFVFAAYAASLIVIAALIGWIMRSHRARKAELAALEQSGVKRRSVKA